MKRVFVAIIFEQSVKSFISKVQKSVEDIASKGKFHREENLHLTVEFIGMVPEKLIKQLWHKIESSVEDIDKFHISLDHLGYFEKKNKKIPWIGVDKTDELEAIQQVVVKAVAEVIEHPIEHGYTPHITLGRQVIIENMPPMHDTLKVEISQIALMESSSATGTLLYTPLFVHNFDDKKN